MRPAIILLIPPPLLFLLSSVGILLSSNLIPARAQEATARFDIIVNSNDDRIQPDDRMTLREAIALSNGELSLAQLSNAEKQLVKTIPAGDRPTALQFNLPTGQTTIALTQALPDLKRPITIDGTTQPGYAANNKPLFAQNTELRAPIVEIKPAAGVEILRGLTVTSDRVTIRGLSLHGFMSSHGLTASTPPADIFIAHPAPPPELVSEPPSNEIFKGVTPPQNIVIEQNWLGLGPDQRLPDRPSAFGISIFNSQGVHIQNNWIAYHDGSGIITGINAKNSHIQQNVITSNGLAGMPDAIRLEGNISESHIIKNHICGNDGSGIYLFKPQGKTKIHDNTIVYNGRRLRRAAIYVTGQNHQIHQNAIEHQTAAGVVIGSYPVSTGNQIYGNQFKSLEGLSVDLNTQHNSDRSDWQQGDGLNPDRNSPNRRNDTGNAAVNAPVFSTRLVAFTDDGLRVSGQADPGSTIEIYRIKSGPSKVPTDLIKPLIPAGPLETPIATVTTDASGHFSTQLSGLTDGDRLSAIAHHPNYGSSEPAINVRIGKGLQKPSIPRNPACLTPPIPEAPPEVPPTVIRLQVPRNVHFALDKDNISPRSARVLDRVAEVLRSNPSLVIELHGHTDPRASDDYNIDLGKRRAQNTRNYLLKQGIDASRMTIRTFGERQRLSDGRGKLDYARDRRTEIIFKDIRDIEVIVQEEDLQIEE